MAINLLSSGNARVDIGDRSELSGAAALTVLITLKPASSFGANRIVTQWGGSQGSQCFLIGAQSSGTSSAVGFVIQNAGSYKGRQTSGSTIAANTLVRLGFRWNASGNVMEIWKDGASQSVSTWIGDGSNASLLNSASSVQVGYETAEAFALVDGDYSEFAIYTAYLSDDDMAAYGVGYSPDLLAQGATSRVAYLPLRNTTDLTDPWSGITGTLTGGSSVDSSPLIMPAGVLSMTQTAAGGGGGGATNAGQLLLLGCGA